jgi:hypothetical protein
MQNYSRKIFILTFLALFAGLFIAWKAHVHFSTIHEIKSLAADEGGSSVGSVKFKLWRDDGGLHSKVGPSDRWIGGKQVTNVSLPEPYLKNWCVDLVNQAGVYEGFVILGLDVDSGKLFILCRSWQNLDVEFIGLDGQIHVFEHRPVSLRPISQWTRKGTEKGVERKM